MNIYIDIETIPSQRDDVKGVIAEGISPPGNISKQETIDKWWDEKAPAAIDNKLRETALVGTFGEIICISWAIDDSQIWSCSRKQEESEGWLLKSFFEDLSASIGERQRPLTWIGHNVSGFDLRFIWQRCVVNKIRPLVEIPYKSKPWDTDVFDTMVEWAGVYGKDKGMSKVCMALGFEGKGDMDGSKVYDTWLAGEYDKIREYCEDDVKRTKLMYKAMMFQ